MEDFETLGDYLEKYNPFALKDSKNRILHFKSRDEIYLYTLKEIRSYCKRGYVELALLVKHLTGFDDDTCFDLEECMHKENGDLCKNPLLLDWGDVGREKEKLQAIFKGLHEATETEFDWCAFEYAWAFFREWNNNYKMNDDETTD